MNKKSSIFHLIFSVTAFLLFSIMIFSGCDNLNGNGKNEKPSSESKTAYISIGDITVVEAGRTALPDITSIDDFTFSLKGKKTSASGDLQTLSDGNGNTTFSGKSNLQYANFAVSIGDWTFELTASKDGTVFTGTTTKEITATAESPTTTISFTMEIDYSQSTSTGSLSFTLDFSGAANRDDVKIVTAGLVNIDTNEPASYETPILNRTTSPDVYTATYDSNTVSALANLAAGKYRIFIRLYTKDTSTNGQILINTWTELAIITGGQTSTGDRRINSLNEVYTINWNLDDGSSSVTLPECYTRLSGDYDLPGASQMTKQGYNFAGWYTGANGTGNLVETIEQGSTGTQNLYAKWTARNDTGYHIYSYMQPTDGSTNLESYVENESLRAMQYGTTENTTNVTADPIEGFKSQQVTQETIAPDGSTIVKIYYDRLSYTITYDDNVSSETITVPSETTALYGATVNVDFTHIGTRTSYLFSGWEDASGSTYAEGGTESFIMGTSDVILSASWTQFYILIDGTNYSTASAAVTAITSASSTSDITVTLSNISASELGKHNNTGTIINAIKETTANSVSLIVPPGQTIELSGDCSYLFQGCTKLVNADLRGFDLSNASNIYSMFYECSGLRTVDVTSFDISKFTSIMFMFYGCSSLEEVDLSNFETKGCQFHSLFYGCSSLRTADLSNFDTSESSTFTDLFHGCTSLVSANLSSFSIKNSSVIAPDMFYGCENLETIIVPDNFDLSSFTGNFDGMFEGCTKLTGGNGTPFDSTKIDNSYARVDKSGAPGYFTGTGFVEIQGTSEPYTFYAATQLEWDETAQTGSRRFIGSRTIAIPNLSVCTHEVTQNEYELYCAYSGDDSQKPVTDSYTGKGDNYPVYYVSWYDAIVYCNLRSMAEGYEPVYALGGETDPSKWPDVGTDDSSGVRKYHGVYSTTNNTTWDAVTMVGSDPSSPNYIVTTANGYRLPTADEWEYLARERNIEPTGQHIYSGTDVLSDYAWYQEDSSNYQMHEVMTKLPNSLGLYDMNGSVNEWCWDWLYRGYFPTSTPITGESSSAENTRCDCGGCWFSTTPSQNLLLYNAAETNVPYARTYGIGFRVVRSRLE